MVYEGDVVWEVLEYEYRVVDRDQGIRLKERLFFFLNVDFDRETGGVVVVLVGLKVYVVGFVEKIKFKEVLKRKGGL